jgi:predicted nucleic acid-binding protein
MIGLDTDILVYATAQQWSEKTKRARDIVGCGLRSIETVVQTLAEFSSVALRKAGMPIAAVVELVDGWQRLLRVALQKQSII